MAVKLINSDAKDFFRRFVCELANSLAEIEMKIPHGAPVPESLQKMLQEIKGWKLAIESQILANEAMWKLIRMFSFTGDSQRKIHIEIA
jgi:hypothetical protein